MIRQFEEQLKLELNNCSSMFDIVSTEAWFWKQQCMSLIAKNQALHAECTRLSETTLLPCEVDDGK